MHVTYRSLVYMNATFHDAFMSRTISNDFLPVTTKLLLPYSGLHNPYFVMLNWLKDYIYRPAYTHRAILARVTEDHRHYVIAVYV